MHPNKLSDRLRLMHWALPAAIALLAAIGQIGPARYVHEHYGDWAHYGIEVFLYAAIGPIVMWFVLGIVRTWIEQKEQAEAEVYRLNIELQQQVDRHLVYIHNASLIGRPARTSAGLCSHYSDCFY